MLRVVNSTPSWVLVMPTSYSKGTKVSSSAPYSLTLIPDKLYICTDPQVTEIGQDSAFFCPLDNSCVPESSVP